MNYIIKLNLFFLILSLESHAFSPAEFTTSKSTSFHKTRAKQMSKKSTRYTYTVIKTTKDARRFEDECQRIGLNIDSKDRGTKINYVYIKNVRLNCERGKTNLGIQSTGLSRGKHINSVTVKNSTIDGNNINLGIQVNRYKGKTVDSDIINNVKIKKSYIKNNNETMKEKIAKKYLNSNL